MQNYRYSSTVIIILCILALPPKFISAYTNLSYTSIYTARGLVQKNLIYFHESILSVKRRRILYIILYIGWCVSMAEIKHLVLAKFKEGVVVEDIIKGMEKLVSDIDTVNSFEWGQDVESQEMLRQGLTHAFLFTFSNKEDFTAYLTHPSHAEFSDTFSTVIENVVLLDFPVVLVKPNNPIKVEPPVLKPVEDQLIQQPILDEPPAAPAPAPAPAPA
ncbi:hypothetical protein Dimus_019962 [Dionaea muscipula]